MASLSWWLQGDRTPYIVTQHSQSDYSKRQGMEMDTFLNSRPEIWPTSTFAKFYWPNSHKPTQIQGYGI